MQIKCKMRVLEMRFTFPFTSEDYAIGYRWTDLLMRETETQDPEDRMLLKSRVNYANKPKMGENFETGTFASFDTDIYSKIDEDYREYFPRSLTKVLWREWHSFPYIKKVVTNDYFKKDFFVKTYICFKDDEGETHNANNLSEGVLKLRKVEHIQLKDYVEKVRYKKAGVGPLEKGWKKTTGKKCTAYITLVCMLDWSIFGQIVERKLLKNTKDVLILTQVRIAENIDSWYGLSMAEVEYLESLENREEEKDKY